MPAELNFLARRSAAFWLALIVLTAIHLALRLHFLHEPFERDEGFYATIATVMLDGGMPYRDAVDIKPPGIFFIYAIFIAIGGESIEAVRIGSSIWSAVTLLVLGLITRHFHGSRAALAAAALFSVFAATPVYQANAANTEIFLGLPLLIWYAGLASYSRQPSRPAIALASLGVSLAVLIKTVMLPFFLLSLIVVLLLARRGHTIGQNWLRPVEWLFLFPLLGIGLLSAWFLVRGGFADFLHWNLTVPASYISSRMVSGPSLTYSLSRHWHEILPFLAPGLIHGIVRLFSPAGRRIDGELILFAGVLASIVAFLLPGKNLPHYYVLLVPLACVLSGIAADRLPGAPRAFALTAFALWCSALAYYATAALPWHREPDVGRVSFSKYNSDLFVQSRHVARYIAEHSLPGETIFQWGFEPQLYFDSGRRPASRYLASIMPLIEGNVGAASRRLAQDLRQQKPRFIVLAESTMMVPGYEVVTRVLNEMAYRPAHQIPYTDDGKQYRFLLYRRPD